MALSATTFSDIGGAVSDLFGASAFRTKAAGLRTEGAEYLAARDLAFQNEAFTKNSTEIQEMQTNRAIEKTLGGQAAQVAASGFGNAGSALDLLRDSANQGALQKAVLSQQGLITEAGYEQQAKSYNLMAANAEMAANAADKAASGATFGAFLKGGAAVFSLFSPISFPGGGK